MAHCGKTQLLSEKSNIISDSLRLRFSVSQNFRVSEFLYFLKLSFGKVCIVHGVKSHRGWRSAHHHSLKKSCIHNWKHFIRLCSSSTFFERRRRQYIRKGNRSSQNENPSNLGLERIFPAHLRRLSLLGFK